mmetsp:Transcript_23516/g.69286  ORF Transcript_23516/g.69286 Transcript_23516/m.69286 type:complete len:203 (-) Transcript_23516:204-812(-)
MRRSVIESPSMSSGTRAILPRRRAPLQPRLANGRPLVPDTRPVPTASRLKPWPRPRPPRRRRARPPARSRPRPRRRLPRPPPAWGRRHRRRRPPPASSRQFPCPARPCRGPDRWCRGRGPCLHGPCRARPCPRRARPRRRPSRRRAWHPSSSCRPWRPVRSLQRVDQCASPSARRGARSAGCWRSLAGACPPRQRRPRRRAW